MTSRLQIPVLIAAVLAMSNPIAVRAQTPAAETQKQIAVLQSGADLHDKARACQQLAATGGKEAVPVLAGLLADEKLAAYARSGLEAIGDPGAGDALRKALGTLHGRFLLGAINSLGVRGDAKAVGALARLVTEKDLELAGVSLSALGQIATPEALKVVERALASRSPELRQSAAEACLTVGDRRLVQGKREEAAAAFERVRRADLPRYTILAATQRLIVAKQAAGLPMLVDLLGSSDAASAAMALRAVRTMPGVEVTRVLVAQLGKAKPEAQAQLVQALLDRNDAAVLPGIESVASTGAPEARVAALTALGEIGAASSVPILLKCLDETKNEAEASAASASLTRLPGKDGDAAILAAVSTARPTVQVKLMGVLSARNVAGTADAALKLAAGSDAEVSRAAFGALATVCRPGDLGELVRLTAAATDDGVREIAGRAVLASAAKLPDIGGRSGPIAAALSASRDAGVKATMLGLLSEIGTYPAYGVAKAALGDPDPQVKAAAVRSLADWPDATPTAVLLGAAKTSTDTTVRSVALRGAIRMCGTLAADCARPSQQVVSWLKQANELIHGDADEKRLIVSAMGNLKSLEGLALVQPYLADAAVRNEAALAAIQIAKQIPTEYRAMAKSVAEKIAVDTKNDAVRGQTEEVVKQIPEKSVDLRVPDPPAGEVDVAKLEFRPLFDGRTFDGWEGDTATAFRIDDGAIVGGNLKVALTQNEFMATTRSYANFVLRADCKLVGVANGGIQIRSQRVPKSAEVCGYQPDMDSSGQYWGCLYDESRRGMLVQADVSKTKEVVKAGDWNAYEIRAEGPRIRIYVNGLLTAEYTEKDPEILLSGIIAVQVHAGNPSETRYRNIRIAELP